MVTLLWVSFSDVKGRTRRTATPKTSGKVRHRIPNVCGGEKTRLMACPTKSGATNHSITTKRINGATSVRREATSHVISPLTTSTAGACSHSYRTTLPRDNRPIRMLFQRGDNGELSLIHNKATTRRPTSNPLNPISPQLIRELRRRCCSSTSGCLIQAVVSSSRPTPTPARLKVATR